MANNVLSFSLLKEQKAFKRTHIDREDQEGEALGWNDYGKWKLGLRKGILERRLKLSKRHNVGFRELWAVEE